MLDEIDRSKACLDKVKLLSPQPEDCQLPKTVLELCVIGVGQSAASFTGSTLNSALTRSIASLV